MIPRIVDGRIDRNIFGFEPSHQIIDPTGALCPVCGSSGHLEGHVSGAALENRYHKKPYDIVDSKIWEEEAKWLAYGLNNTIVHWSPAVVALGGDEFNTTLLSYNLPRITRILLTIAMVGLISSVFLSLILLPPKPPKYGKWKYLMMVLQWLLIPFTLIIFGAFPAIEAQTRLLIGRYLGFWPTEKFRKE